jgi:Ca2+-binding EF-hand superfamily protein
MRKLLLICSMLLWVVRLPAQSNQPVRLALISETGESAAVSDLLTAKLSADQRLQLLERNEIERVYREQALSAGNKDCLKLGRILGADGLLLFEVVRGKHETNLTARLVAVKPGVVLTEGSFSWPLKDARQWAEEIASYLNSFLPKLRVLVKDAIPISVVNLRSAVQSADSVELEKQLTLLAIQRLSREPRLFVLERQRMQMLSEEKELKLDDSAFWSGSYLLDGVLDQNGYSRDTITLNARLSPRLGGTPVALELSGSRTNLGELVNQLAAKVTAALNFTSEFKEWSASDEAEQFFAEAKWALRWGILRQAQAAAESAWALGKRDLDCALVRIKAYADEVPKLAPPNTVYYRDGLRDAHYVNINEPPDPKDCDVALYALKCYYDFSRNSPDGEPRVLWKETPQERGLGWHDWHNSDWYKIGIDDLVVASRVLQHFYCVPESQKPVAAKLAELRELARSVAEFIFQSPSVHESYFVGDRLAAHDELSYTIEENPNIFDCVVRWGCFWQERPEDCVALYRQLMSSPAFSYIHTHLWIREPLAPRLIAWRPEDQRHVPIIWDDFIRELATSTNGLLNLEAKAMQLADAADEREMAKSFTNFFDCIFENRDLLVTNNVEVLYLKWGVDDLVSAILSRISSPNGESLRRLFYSEYWPKLEAMDQEYWLKTVPAGQLASVFPRQRQYLRTNQPFDFLEFAQLFLSHSRNYTKSQALELQPLVAAYKSNLLAQSRIAIGIRKAQLSSGIGPIDALQRELTLVLNSTSAPPVAETVIRVNPAQLTRAQAKANSNQSGEQVENPSDILLVKDFLEIPRDHAKGDQPSQFGISSQRWSEGKLLIHVRYSAFFYDLDERGRWKSTRGRQLASIAIYDPDNLRWDIVDCPELSADEFPLLNDAPDRMILLHGKLFVSQAGQIKRFDFRTREWWTLPIPKLGDCALSAVDGRLFGATRETIFEILDDGKGTRILAGTRRRPPVSVLDSLEDLGTPMLFEGPNHSVFACVAKTIFDWNGTDWREVIALNCSQTPELLDDAIVFRSIPSFGSDDPATLSIWRKDRSRPELCLRDKPRPHTGIINMQPRKLDPSPAQPSWSSLEEDYLTSCPVTCSKSNLYFLVEHAEQSNVAGRWRPWDVDLTHAKLVCLSRDSAEPVDVPLKFDLRIAQHTLGALPKNAEPWRFMNPAAAPVAMIFSDTTLFLCERNASGIWAIPLSDLDSVINARKQHRLARRAQQTQEAGFAEERLRKNLLAKYDRNHNGTIDPEEREAAIDDPAFLEWELPRIHTNHSAWLSAEELSYFDANQNGILDPPEEHGIRITLNLLAAKLIHDFDRNGKGQLDQNEFASALSYESMGRALMEFHRYDTNHEGELSQDELAHCLEQRTLREIWLPPTLPHRGYANAQGALRLSFKDYVERYWAAKRRETNPAVKPENPAVPATVSGSKP